MLVTVGLTCQGPLGKNVFLDPGFTANPALSALYALSTQLIQLLHHTATPACSIIKNRL